MLDLDFAEVFSSGGPLVATQFAHGSLVVSLPNTLEHKQDLQGQDEH